MQVVIMAGGRGTRFWPHSRIQRPKQFLHIVGEDTMLRQTYDRIRSIAPPDAIWVVTNAEYGATVAEQLPDLPEENIISEPAIRSTAPCIGLTALHIRHRVGNEMMVVLPADHFIPDTDQFIQCLRTCEATAEKEAGFVTIGINPTAPETGYGYIHVGDALGKNIHHVRGFREKPDRIKAEQFLSGGEHLWNSGMFVWSVDAILSGLEQYCPEVYSGLSALDAYIGTDEEGAQLARIYTELPNISIDYAVMEKASRVYVVIGGFSWSDVGSWSAVEQFWPIDADGNAFKGQVVGIDVHNSIVDSSDKLTAIVGLDDIIVINTSDALLICHKDRDQDIKKIIERLEDLGQQEYL